MFGRVLRMFLWVSYDNLGKLLVVNILWTAMCAASVGLAVEVCTSFRQQTVWALLLVSAFLAGLVCVTATLGLMHVVMLCALKKDARISDLFRGMRRFLGRGMRVTPLLLLCQAALLVAILFYGRMAAEVPGWRMVGIVLRGIGIWMFIVFNLMLIYLLPMLVREDVLLRRALKLSLYFVFDNLWLTLGVALFLVVMLTTCVFTRVGLPIIGAALTAVLMVSTYLQVARRYVEPGKLEDTLAADDEDYANRGWRDIIQPWRM